MQMRRTSFLAVALAAVFAIGVPAAATAPAPTTRIVGGHDTAVGAYPAMAALFLELSGRWYHICGATLITSEHVLTAAHCLVDDQGQLRDSQRYAVMIGSDDYRASPTQVRWIAGQAVHPDYDADLIRQDVAVLQLATPVTGPVQVLATAPDSTSPPATVTTVGYGATQPDGDSSSASPRLQEADVPLVSDADCDAAYRGFIDPEAHVCAGDPSGDPAAPGTDSCQGDSGGPLLRQLDGVSVQIGVTSFGGLCGVDYPGAYAEVDTYIGWIADVTGHPELAGSTTGDTSGSVGAAPATQPAPTQEAPEEPTEEPTDEPTDQPTDQPTEEPTAPGPGDEDASGSGHTPVPEPARVQAGGATDSVGLADHLLASLPDSSAASALVARSDVFADALGATGLHGGASPLLLTGSDGRLSEHTLAQLGRVVSSGGHVYLLGGPRAVDAAVDEDIRGLGLTPIRLAGAERTATARLVAEEVVRRFGSGDRPAHGSAIVAYAHNWPDAVSAGTLSSWLGIPVLLTDRDTLSAATEEFLVTHDVDTALVLGGQAVVADAVVARLEQLVGRVHRLAGATRFGTMAEVNAAHRDLFGGDPGSVVVANLRRDDAFAQVLLASQLTATGQGLLVGVEGPDGSGLPAEMAAGLCGLEVPVTAFGGSDVVAAEALQAVHDRVWASAC